MDVRHKTKHWIWWVIIFVALLMSCSRCTGINPDDDPGSQDGVLSKSVILFIGDGMGAEHRLAANLQSGSILVMDNMPVYGYLRTGAADNPVTDSAAAATAMATGVKTNNGVIGMDPGLNVLRSLLEEAEQKGMATGLITDFFNDRVPVAFAPRQYRQNQWFC